MGRIENREEPEQVGPAVDGDPADGEHRMGVFAALHVEAAVGFGIDLDGREQADETDRIGVAEEGRDGTDFLDADFAAHPAAKFQHGTVHPLGDLGLAEPEARQGIRELGPETDRHEKRPDATDPASHRSGIERSD